MVELHGVSNSGFSFSDTYLKNISDLTEYVQENLEKEVTYVDIQEYLGNPSRIRMIVPFLKHLNIIDKKFFEVNNTKFKLKELFTDHGEKFKRVIEIYSLIKKLEGNEIASSRWKELFRAILFHEYLKDLCINKKEYLIIIKYLLLFKTIDKFEFFVITSMELNNIPNIFGHTNAKDVILQHRDSNYNSSNYIFKTNINSYSYMMQVLCDFNVCEKKDGYYKITDQTKITKILEELL